MHRQKSDRSIRPRNAAAVRMKAPLSCAIGVGILLTAMLQPALSVTRVQGGHDDLQVQAENATVGEVLKALSGRFNLSYRLSPDVTRTFTGVYTGTLNQVLGRVLDGNDYVVNISAGAIEVVVLRASGAAAVVANNQASVEQRATPTVAPAPAGQAAAAAVAPSSAPPLNSFLSVN